MLSRALMQIQMVVLASALTLTPGMLWAQSASDKSAAQEAFKKGQIQYNLGRFEKALEHFSTAYETMPHGAFLFNIGQCHRHLGNHEKAIFFFEGYLRNLPNAPNRSDVEDLISEHRAKLAIAKTRKANPPKKKKPLPKKKKTKRKKPKKTAAAPAAVEKPAPAPKEAPQPPEIKSADQESWVVWALIGGVAVLGTAIVIATIASRSGSSGTTGDGDTADSNTGNDSDDASFGTVDIRPN